MKMTSRKFLKIEFEPGANVDTDAGEIDNMLMILVFSIDTVLVISMFSIDNVLVILVLSIDILISADIVVGDIGV